MSIPFNGAGLFQVTTTGNPVVTTTAISSTWANALSADLATGLSTCVTKDGQTATTARIPFALGINSTLTTDTTSASTGSIITAGGIGIAKALFVGDNILTAGGNIYFGGTTVSDVKLLKNGATLALRLADASEYAPFVCNNITLESTGSSIGSINFGLSAAGTARLHGTGTTILCQLGNGSGYATFDAGAYKVGGVAGVSFSGATITTLTVVNGLVTGHT